nr:hypothetical protein [Nocardioides alcanivorans]
MNPVAPDQPRRLLLAVDAPSLLHRNHHARAHTDLRDRTNRPAWALHGMLRQILESIDSFAPDAVIFGIDDRRDSVRERLYPDYKAGRAPRTTPSSTNSSAPVPCSMRWVWQPSPHPDSRPTTSTHPPRPGQSSTTGSA